MVRTIIADSALEKYLENLLDTVNFSYGIVIGQVFLRKFCFLLDYFIVHATNNIIL